MGRTRTGRMPAYKHECLYLERQVGPALWKAGGAHADCIVCSDCHAIVANAEVGPGKS